MFPKVVRAFGNCEKVKKLVVPTDNRRNTFRIQANYQIRSIKQRVEFNVIAN
jgi:hypothetical protein